MNKGTVAIVGGGVGGLVAARYLKTQGFSPTIFESHDSFGGQWNRDNPNSGIWPDMRTNTAHFVTKLSDVQYPEKVHIFPRNTDVLAMLKDFAKMHGLDAFARFRVTVTGVFKKKCTGYSVEWIQGCESKSADFDRVIIASGRFNLPEVPAITGLDSFSGECGVIHAFRYKNPEKYRDKNIIVLGGAVSALEVASDQAMMGNGQVYLSQRRQRYVVPKMFAGTPFEYFAFTRQGALGLENMSGEDLLASQKEFLLRYGCDPARYGAPATDPDISRAGVTVSQHYLNLVAEDRIDVRPCISKVDGKTVTFADGQEVEADAIILGTGFELNLPFLSDEIAETINLGPKGLELANFTFHPDLPGLAFVGLWSQRGSYPVVLEQQARWIAYCWGGAIMAPGEKALRHGVQHCIDENHHGGYRSQNEMAIRFAKLAGTDPSKIEDPELVEILSNNAVTGEMFRIVGIDADPNAEACLRSQFWSYAAPDVRLEIARRYGRRIDGSSLTTG
ncbi:NAD(P)/FAD-dependent oxidoreductase [Pararhizobium sp. IMCC21322]|uniref:flavin-containing monooxygenase n=1 Tax=Pararhizobium sp. IMCC21322 TaxID=3067903 RepID=UPI002740AF2F|nr:FAD-dependent oxidoreductase [Pararhizobium sp. IMCC21322]